MNCHILPFCDGNTKIRLMFQDEASFGRINEPRRCWCPKGVRPVVPSLKIREYMQCYGAVEPFAGDSFFLVLPKTNIECMNIYLEKLSGYIGDDYLLLITDRAAWHTSKKLQVPENIRIVHIPPATPEMNPIEQIWKELRKSFKNELFKTLDGVIDRLCQAINNLTPSTITRITGRDWIMGMF